MSSKTQTQQFWYGNGMKFCEYGDYACLPYEEIEADDEDIVKCPNCDGYCGKCETQGCNNAVNHIHAFGCVILCEEHGKGHCSGTSEQQNCHLCCE